MNTLQSSFLDKVLGRIGRLDKEGLQSVVERLDRERRFLETLFNSIEDGVLVVDENGRILYFNHAVENMLGLQDSAEGQPVARFLPQLDWPKLSHADRVGGVRVTRHEIEVQYPRHRYLSLYVAPLDGERAGSSGMALILHDATEARQQAFAAIESERSQALTLLAASVAHEIGNPLNALHIHLQLMEREVRKLRTPEAPARTGLLRTRRKAAAGPNPEIADRLERYLNVAKGEITRLDYIVTQFLQALRPAPPQLRLVAINDVVVETIDLLRPEIDNRNLTLVDRLTRHLPPVPVDAGQVKQVLVNLCKNAMQAMTRGGTLTLFTEAAPDGVIVGVSDTGTGMPPEMLTRIFEPFYTTKKKGSGLGLMIVQRIVRAHGGRIHLDSHPGRGTTFRIWLPLGDRQPRMIEAGSSPDEPPPASAEDAP